ncbi:MAG: hypothetical protein WB650_01660 [Candidatus Binatus sp.]
MLPVVSMLYSVKLNDQPRFDTAEIHDEGVDRNLPPKFPTVEVSIS